MFYNLVANSRNLIGIHDVVGHINLEPALQG